MSRWLRYAPIVMVLGGSLAHADPSPCRVTISSAPDDVAAEIQHWVASEPRCARELDIRVERGAFGLHLTATDSTGQHRERVVPDAQSAAVLVVSWMADDSFDEPAAAAPEARIEPSGAILIERLDELPSRTSVPSAGSLSPHWFTIGMSLTDDGYGVRGQVDILALGHWRVGVGGGWRSDAENSPDLDTPMQPSSSLSDALAFGAYTHALGPFDVRLQAGLGVAVDSRHDPMDPRDNRTTVSPEVDLAALLDFRLGDHWGLVAGPLLDLARDRNVPLELSGLFGIARRM